MCAINDVLLFEALTPGTVPFITGCVSCGPEFQTGLPVVPFIVDGPEQYRDQHESQRAIANSQPSDKVIC